MHRPQEEKWQYWKEESRSDGGLWRVWEYQRKFQKAERGSKRQQQEMEMGEKLTERKEEEGKQQRKLKSALSGDRLQSKNQILEQREIKGLNPGVE